MIVDVPERSVNECVSYWMENGYWVDKTYQNKPDFITIKFRLKPEKLEAEVDTFLGGR